MVWQQKHLNLECVFKQLFPTRLKKDEDFK